MLKGLGADTDADGDTLAARLLTGPTNPLFAMKTNGAFTYDARFHGEMTLEDGGGDAVLLDEGFNSLGAGAVVYDTFTYAAGDGVNEDDATVTIEITGVNDDPVAFADSGTTLNGEATVDVLANDTDVDTWPTRDDENFTITALADIADDGGPAGTSDDDNSDGLSITTDAGGTATVVNGQVVYEAADGFFGIDTFTYTVAD